MGQIPDSDKDFYIGWQNEAPDSFSRAVKQFVIAIAIIIPLVSFVLVSQQRGFSTSNFEFGSLVELEGVLEMKPFPSLKVENGKDLFGKISYQRILLVGFGKLGAENDLLGHNADGKKIKIEGTLIYHDGQALLELTNGASSILNIGESIQTAAYLERYGKTTLKGEILDAKCYFGVMKPGEGKPHRSCAVRCISGGIPPVLGVTNEKEETNYFLIVGKDGNPINQEILEYVGQPIAICGELQKLDDWMVLKVDLEEEIKKLGFGSLNMPMCAQ